MIKIENPFAIKQILKSIFHPQKAGEEAAKEYIENKKPKGISLNNERRVYCVSCGCYYHMSNLYTNETNWMCPSCEKKFKLNSANRSG